MRVLCTADWHVGSYNNVNAQRENDFLAAIDQIVDSAAIQKPDLILHAGDVFRTNRPSGHHQREAAQRFKSLSDIAPTVLIPGNHDITASGSAIDDWGELAPDNLHVCIQPHVVRLPFCNVVAIPWLTSRYLAEFGKSKTREKQELGNAIEMLLQAIVAGLDDKPKILLAHATALDGKMGEYRPTVLGDDLLWPGIWFEPFDFVCLGHLHKAQVVYTSPYAIYPGSPERVTFGERDEPKCFSVMKLGARPIFHELKPRPMVQLEGDVDEVTSQLKDVPDEAMLKIRVHLEPEERFEVAGNRWFDLRVEEIRPQPERESRVSGIELQGMSFSELLNLYFTLNKFKPERIALLVKRAEEMALEREERNAIQDD